MVAGSFEEIDEILNKNLLFLLILFNGFKISIIIKNSLYLRKIDVKKVGKYLL